LSEQKPVDHFTIIPRRFTDAHLADELDHLHVLIGLHVAARCYEVRNTSDGVAAIRLTQLAELCGNVSIETIRRKLHELEPTWIACEVEPGQRSAWRIRLTGLAHEAVADTPHPHDLHTTSTETPPRVWRSTSTGLEAAEGLNPHGKRERTSTRPPELASEEQDIRDETKRDENETKAASSENQDHLGVETTAASNDLADALGRARLFDEMFPPRRWRTS